MQGCCPTSFEISALENYLTFNRLIFGERKIKTGVNRLSLISNQKVFERQTES